MAGSFQPTRLTRPDRPNRAFSDGLVLAHQKVPKVTKRSRGVAGFYWRPLPVELSMLLNGRIRTGGIGGAFPSSLPLAHRAAFRIVGNDRLRSRWLDATSSCLEFSTLDENSTEGQGGKTAPSSRSADPQAGKGRGRRAASPCSESRGVPAFVSFDAFCSNSAGRKVAGDAASQKPSRRLGRGPSVESVCGPSLGEDQEFK